MAVSHRKALSTPQKLSGFVGVECSISCPHINELSPPPTPPPPPLLPPGEPSLSPFLILMFCGLAVAFSFICYLTLSSRYRTYRTNSRRRNLDETQEDFIDEEQGPVIHHPIWLINTIGLEQSVIDSIEVFKYKKGEGLIDGSDCSVCLSEFQEDESLRLLPKCSHAFHVPCIDTWLRSHKNCPLCRAPIVKNTSNAQVNIAAEENLSEFTGMEEIPLGDSENVDLQRGNNANEAASVQEIDNGNEGLEKNSLVLNVTSSGVRVQSDLADHLRVQVGEEAQPIRRSVSLDSSVASMIHLAVANIPLADQERCLGSCQLVLPKKPNHLPKSAKGHKRRGSSSSISIYSRLMKSSSIGRVSQKASSSIRRSYSSSSKCSQNRSY